MEKILYCIMFSPLLWVAGIYLFNLVLSVYFVATEGIESKSIFGRITETVFCFMIMASPIGVLLGAFLCDESMKESKLGRYAFYYVVWSTLLSFVSLIILKTCYA